MLKFTARSLEAADLDLAVRRGPAMWHLGAGAGTIATAAGPMTLYAEKLVGTYLSLGGKTPASQGRVVITPTSVPQWLSAPGPASGNARHKEVTIGGASFYQIRLTGGSLKVPRPHIRTA